MRQIKVTQNLAKPYAKCLDDELDWKLLDQLYGVVSQISNFCFETKKFCITIEFVVLAFIAKFTSDKLDHSFFVAGLAIPLTFWFVDSVAYFYQVKLRGLMEDIRKRIKNRNTGQLVNISGVPVIEADRVNISIKDKIIDAGFNHSMWIYGLLIAADIVIWSIFWLRGVL